MFIYYIVYLSKSFIFLWKILNVKLGGGGGVNSMKKIKLICIRVIINIFLLVYICIIINLEKKIY